MTVHPKLQNGFRTVESTQCRRLLCIENINLPMTFTKTINMGHSAGNHTFNHLNGWKTATDEYSNISLCEIQFLI
jgi:hypothetical protein